MTRTISYLTLALVLLLSVFSQAAPEENILASEDPSTWSSGRKHLEAASKAFLPGPDALKPPDPGAPPKNYSEPRNGGMAFMTCTADPTNPKRAEGKSDGFPILAENSEFYPGNLIQGKDFALSVQFNPITIPRAGGRIILNGLTLDPSATYYEDVPQMSESEVKAAIGRLLSKNKIIGRAAQGEYITKQVYSSEHVYFELGIDARYRNFSLDSQLSVDSKSNTNQVMMKFTQIFYTIGFENPASRYAVFRDGINFEDEEETMGEDNPPLLIRSVSYGRTILFVAKSEESALEISAALKGAYDDGMGTKLSAEAKAKYEKTLSSAEMSYYLLGGSAKLGLSPVKGKAADMFDRIRAVIAEGAEYSATNPGVPIAYKLSYLYNRKPAAMGYATSYNRRDCAVTPAQFANYVISFSYIDDDATVYIDGKPQFKSSYLARGSTPRVYDLHTNIPTDGDDHWLAIQLTNGGCFGSGIAFQVEKKSQDNPTQVLSEDVGWGVANCGTQAWYLYQINRSPTGVFRLVDSCKSNLHYCENLRLKFP